MIMRRRVTRYIIVFEYCKLDLQNIAKELSEINRVGKMQKCIRFL